MGIGKEFFMKLVEAVSATVSVIIFIWFLASWINVLSCNSPRNPTEPADWNAFVVMTEVVK